MANQHIDTDCSFPESPYIDLSQDENGGQVVSTLKEWGYARFDNVTSREGLVGLAQRLGPIILHRDADELGITEVTPHDVDPALSSGLGFTDQELMLHTDGTAVPMPARFIVLCCATPARLGGTTRLLDGRLLHVSLADSYPSLLEKLQTPDSTIFGDPGSNRYVGSVFAKDDADQWRIRFRADKEVRYSNLSGAEINSLIEIMNSLATEFKLEQGQGYIASNTRVLHARTAFRGLRRMWRALVGEPSSPDHLGQFILPGFK